MKKRLIAIAFMLLCFIPIASYALETTLAWEANSESNLAGYKLYYGSQPGGTYNGTDAIEGNSPIDLPLNYLYDINNPEFTLTGLAENETYYYVITAYAEDGTESSFSNEVSFQPYVYTNVYTCGNIQHGDTNETYWDIQPIDIKSNFTASETIYLLVKINNIYTDHEWKVEIYYNDNFWWQYESGWQYVDNWWNFTNLVLPINHSPEGLIRFDVYLDIGNNEGYKYLDSKTIEVTRDSDYTYMTSYTCEAYKAGSSNKYWNFQPINPSDNFLRGQPFYLLSKLKDVYVNHRWRAEVYYNNIFWYQYTSPWQQVTGVWEYTNLILPMSNPPAGEIMFKVYLDIGWGFNEPLDIISVTVQ
ncbi:MAG: hypothetical protein ABIG60_02110 [Patescibacteria group bacterium]